MEIANNTNVPNSQFQTVAEKESLSNEDFMKLLLAELKYQDPTKPMDTQAMIDQTMQMSTIEANNTNIKALESMQRSFASTQMLNSVDLIGKHIDTGNRHIELQNATSEFSVFFDSDVSTGTIDIKNSDGVAVGSINIDGLKAGQTTLNWDGKDANGNLFPDGVYSLAVDAKDSANNKIEANVGTYSVSALEFNNGEVTVVANGYKIALNDVKKIW